jgi:6,7-dimethyl-8-ribityllumazine synthase
LRVIEGNKRLTDKRVTDERVADERFGIVVSRYHATITEKLLEGAIVTLTAMGAAEAQIDVAHVPGAWEIPIAAQRMLETRQYDAVLCLGAVIKGETTHDAYISQQVSLSLGRLALDMKTPVLFGLLTCQTMEQAKNRAGGRVGNKGAECAEAAVEMVSLLRQIG